MVEEPGFSPEEPCQCEPIGVLEWLLSLVVAVMLLWQWALYMEAAYGRSPYGGYDTNLGIILIRLIATTLDAIMLGLLFAWAVYKRPFHWTRLTLYIACVLGVGLALFEGWYASIIDFENKDKFSGGIEVKSNMGIPASLLFAGYPFLKLTGRYLITYAVRNRRG